MQNESSSLDSHSCCPSLPSKFVEAAFASFCSALLTVCCSNIRCEAKRSFRPCEIEAHPSKKMDAVGIEPTTIHNLQLMRSEYHTPRPSARYWFLMKDIFAL